MTVVNPKSISGINSITMASGGDDLLTIHSNNTTERVRVNNSGDVIVGSGVTLSPDGDVFATGVCTATSFVGNGSGLTNLATDLVNDTSPQLGGNLDVNTKNINFGDSGSTTDDRLVFGADSDLMIYHNGSDSVIREQGTGNLDIQTTGGNVDILVNTTEHAAKFISDGAVELYHDGTKQVETSANGLAFPSGKGIDFSATSDLGGKTSELLDDYEEGTYTPILTGSSSNPTQSYAHQNGYYTKIGRLVHVSVDIKMAASGVSGGSGVVLLNLPFNQANLTNNQGAAASIGYAPSWGAITPTAAYSSPNDTVLYLLGNDKDTGANFVQASQVGNDTRLIIGFSYITET